MNLTEKETIRNVLNGVSSRENAKRVVNWFSSSVEGLQCLSELIDRDAYLLETASVSEITPTKSAALFAKINRNIHEKRQKTTILRVAAVLVPFVILLGLGAYLGARADLFGTAAYAEVHIPKGEKGRLFFQDGTEVFLNSDTKIRYPKKFGLRKRDVYLQGEAYFNVAGNKHCPFIVHTSEDTNVKVTGTSFNVNAYDSNPNVRVTLDEGKIAFNTPKNSYNIRPGQEFMYNKNTGETRILALSRPSSRSLWKNDIIYLHDTPLADVIKILERRYDVVFDVKNPQAMNYSFTLITKQSSVDSVLLELRKIAPLKFRKHGNVIEVSHL